MVDAASGSERKLRTAGRRVAICALPIAVAAACLGTRTDNRADISGRWQGAVSLFGATSSLIVDITPESDSLRAGVTMDVEAL